MLGSRRKKEETKSEKILPQASNCIISQGSVIEGKFNSKDSLRLDGQVNGEIDCESRFVMGETGKVVGSVRAAEAEILGEIEGDIMVSGSLNLRSTAKIKGNITAKTMSVDEGATYNGECRIGEFVSQKITRVVKAEA